MKREDVFEEDSRYRQCNKEAVVTSAFFIINILVIGIVPMVIGYKKSVDDIEIVGGFPSWFFYGCIVGWIVLSVLSILMVKLFFKDMDLD